ncbi:MAG: hypothetical protein ABIK09_20265 [Pseudomonadota bacterium]
MTRTRPQTILASVLLLLFVACNEGDPQKDGGGDAPELDAAGDVGLDAPGELPPSDSLADTPDPLDIPPDLPTDIHEDVPVDLDPETVEVPCAAHVECDDGDPCTGDFCEGGVCTHQAKNCGDGNACTQDLCDPGTGQCAYELLDCDDGNECTLDSCKPDTGCETIELSDCCPPEMVGLWDMENALQGVELTNLQPVDSPAVTWQLSTARAWTGETSLYFGDPGTLTYDSGHRVRASALFPAVTVPEGHDVELRMYVWLDIEDAFDWDTFTVFANAGEVRIPMLVKTFQTDYEEWTEWTVLLNAFAGQEVQIELHFDSMDGGANTGEGLYVDDLRVAVRCPLPETCIAAVDCNDQALCTGDSCQGGQCVYDVNAACCLSESHCVDDDQCTINDCDGGSCVLFEVEPPFCCNNDADCDDANVCTADTCFEGYCFHGPSGEPGCCEIDADCDDNSTCTIDKCEDATCVNINTCCYSDEECDDGDEICTNDVCIANKCKFLPTGVDGCCTEDMLLDTFDATDATTDWLFGPPGGNNVGWHIWQTPTTGDDGPTLYYGNPGAGNFESNGANSGEAISPEIWLQPGVDDALTFEYFQDSESGTYYDMCWLYVSWTEGADTWVEIWSKAQYTAMNTWQTYTVNLNGLAGETVRFRWYFASGDSISNNGKGVLVDNFHVHSTCQPVVCQSNFECADSVPGTDGICVDQNLCAFEVSNEICSSVADCNDGDQCTVDTCQSQLCSHAPVQACCYTNEECDDTNVCTADTCAPGVPAPTCQNPWTPGCCLTVDECNDGNACTEDLCPGVGEQCLNPAIEGCCLTDAECADADVCTVDTCTDNVCVSTPVPAEECCYVHEDCDDDNPCSEDICNLGAMPHALCIHDWIPDCCYVDADCADGNPCTADICPAYGELCTNDWIEGCCLKNSDCADDDPCTWDLCVDNVCQFIGLCCAGDEECDDGDDVCTTDACVGGACVFTPTGADGCCSEPLFRDDFSEDLGWEYGYSWERGEAIASVNSVYNDDPDLDHSSSADDNLAGVVIGGMAPTSLGGFYWLTSPQVDISQAVAPHLSYWRWLNSDYTPYMQNKVEVYNGSAWVNVWITGSSPGVSDSAWGHHDYDVTQYKSASFRVRFGYNVGSAGVFTISSWNLDDVQLYDAAPLAMSTNLCCAQTSDCLGVAAGTECVAGECQ